MRYYPLFLDITKSSCFLAGAGAVGRRKLGTLLKCTPRSVLVLDSQLNQKTFTDLCHQDGIADLSAVQFYQRDFCEQDLDNIQLAFAASSDHALNEHIAALCAQKNISCNVADAPDAGNFIVPAHIESGPLVLALSTGGCSPALAKALKEDLVILLGERYIPVLNLLDKLRPLLLSEKLGSPENAKIFRALTAKPVRERLSGALADLKQPCQTANAVTHEQIVRRVTAQRQIAEILEPLLPKQVFKRLCEETQNFLSM